MALAGGRRMRTEEEIRRRIKTLNELRKEFNELRDFKSAMVCVERIEMLEWVIESEASNV